jgi:hypothetical protein
MGKLRSWALDTDPEDQDLCPADIRSPVTGRPLITNGADREDPRTNPLGRINAGRLSGFRKLRSLMVEDEPNEEESFAQKLETDPNAAGALSATPPAVRMQGLDSSENVRDGSRNASTPSGGLQKLLSVFSKPAEREIDTVAFNPGETSIPSLEGALRDVNITYIVEEPYQFVHIEYVRQEGALIYSVAEPALSDEEESALRIIENAFEKLVSTNVELIDAAQREIYLHDRFYSLMHIFGLKLTDTQKQRMFFHLKKNYLGYGRIDTLMRDKYIEDISCNGSNMNIYVQHRTYGSIRTDVQFGEIDLNNFVLKLAQVSGRHVSLLQPIRDLTLPDGSRANITLGGEVTKRGSTFTIRKFRANPISSIERRTTACVHVDPYGIQALDSRIGWNRHR